MFCELSSPQGGELFSIQMDLDPLLNDDDLAHALKVAEEAYSANVAAHRIHSVVSGENAHRVQKAGGTVGSRRTVSFGNQNADPAQKEHGGVKIIKAPPECRVLSFRSDILWERVAVLSTCVVVGRWKFENSSTTNMLDWLMKKWANLLGYSLVTSKLKEGWFCFQF